VGLLCFLPWDAKGALIDGQASSHAISDPLRAPRAVASTPHGVIGSSGHSKKDLGKVALLRPRACQFGICGCAGEEPQPHPATGRVRRHSECWGNGSSITLPKVGTPD